MKTCHHVLRDKARQDFWSLEQGFLRPTAILKAEKALGKSWFSLVISSADWQPYLFSGNLKQLNKRIENI